MDKQKISIKDIRMFKKGLSFKIPVDKMILFGSMAYGRIHKDSDVDLMIVSKKFKNVKSYMRSAGFYKYWKVDYPVDFLCYTPEEFDKLKKQVTIVREAVREGIEIK